MATKIDPQTEQDPEVMIESAIGRTENFIINNGKSLLTVLVVVVLIVAGFFGYKYLIAAPRAEKASAMMFVAEQRFAIDSFALALNGDPNGAGFLNVIEQYGSTAPGNLATHYAGICCLNLGNYAEALSFLGKFSAPKGIPGAVLGAQNLGLQGDASAQLEKYKEAVTLYEKAVTASDNALTAPYYLKKAGLVYEKLGDNAKALATYKRIAAEYGVSMEGRDIQKYIGRLEQL